MDSSRNGTCGRRMWVIHTLGVSSTLIHIATRFGTSQDITQHSTAQRNKKGRPAEAGLPCKNLESRISAQQHRRNGKSIQCPSNVTTYLGHTLFVGSALKLFLYFVIMLNNPAIANRNRLMFPIYRNCCFSIARIAKMLHAVRIATLACSFTFICPEKTACRKHISPTRRTNVNSCLIFLSFARHSKHLRIK